MKESLLSWLNPEATDEEPAAPVAQVAEQPKPAAFALNTAKKTNVDEEFDELFNLK
jgi:hypothetical protein